MRNWRALLTSFMTAWLLAVSLATAAPAQQDAKTDEHPTLPAGEGRDMVIKVCSSCHQPEMVTEEALDQDGWKEVVDQMVANGATASGAERTQIIQYLAKAFPPR